MDQSVIRPVRESPSPWFAFWQLCLYGTLLNGCVLAVTHTLELSAVAIALLWLCGGLGLALYLLRKRNLFWKLAPLVLPVLVLVAGNPIRGAAGWLNNLLLRWNALHKDGLRLIALTAAPKDSLSFAILVTAALAFWCGRIVEYKRMYLTFLTAAAMMALCVIGGCENSFVFALLTGALLGVLISGNTGKPGHQGCVLWALVCIQLLAAAAFLPKQFSGYTGWRESLSQSFHELRYGHETLPMGDLYQASELKSNPKAVLQITSQQKKSLYFPAFLGGSYENGAWSSLPKSSFGGDNTGMLKWLQNRDFQPQTQSALYTSLANPGTKTNVLRIRVLSGSRDTLYVPSSLETITGKGKADRDGLVSARGLTGQKSYAVTERSGGKPGELQVAADWLQDPQTEAERDYAQSEAVYRNFVYNQYTQVAPEVQAAVQAVFHETEPQSETVFGVLTHVRQVLRERAALDETARPPEDAEPIVWFLSGGRGGEMLYASAAVQALRSYGIPARYAEGYYLSSGRIGDNGTVYLTGRNARAWVEVYFDGIGWTPLDVVPGFYYDLVSLQQMVSLPDDVTKTSAVLNDDSSPEEMGTDAGDETPDTPDIPPENTSVNGIVLLLILLAGFLILIVLMAEFARALWKSWFGRKWYRAAPLERAALAENATYRLLSAWGIHASLGWKTEEIDTLVARVCPKAAPGDYARVVELLEKSIYGDIPPEIYEERTLKAFLKKLSGPFGKASLSKKLRARYCWIGAL